MLAASTCCRHLLPNAAYAAAAIAAATAAATTAVATAAAPTAEATAAATTAAATAAAGLSSIRSTTATPRTQLLQLAAALYS